MTEAFFHELLSLNVLIQLLHLCKRHLSIFHHNFPKEINAIALLLARLDSMYDHMFVWLIESYETKYVVSGSRAVYS